MQDPELAIEELERCMKDLNFSGFKSELIFKEKNLDHPDLFPVFEAAERLGASLLCIRG